MTNGTKRYDLVVIGGGPGGYVAAIRAAQLGMQVAVVERDRLGGVCLNWGCIPTKALLHNAEVFDLFRRAHEFGISAENVKVDFAAVIRRSRQIAGRLNKGVEFLFRKNKIDHVPGTGTLLARNRVGVTDGSGKAVAELEAPRIILATGSRPRPLPNVPVDQKRIITSDEAVVLEALPASIVIVGAGAVGVEFADIYQKFGSRVTLVEMLPRIVPVEDAEVSDLLAKSFARRGIDVRTGARVETVEVSGAAAKVRLQREGKTEEVEGEAVLVAIGRMPNSEGLGLEAAGVRVEKGFVAVNESLETSAPGIYAIGDLVGPPLLAHKASAEGIVAVERMRGLRAPAVKPQDVPGCTYCQPQVASIGLTEEKAREAGYNLKVGKFPFQASGKAIALGRTEGFVKVVADGETGEVLGVHIIGEGATELIAEVGVARTLESTVEEVIRTIHAHPTLSEAVAEGMLAALGRSIHS